jgi:RHS repeat-associated protein
VSVFYGTLGSVRSSSNEYGVLEDRYEYDAFGKPYKGEFGDGMNLGYTGKPYDTTTGLYNYGYRDYKPEAARFTTVDPIRDGSNWFAYVNNDPVNWVDPWGLWKRNTDGTYTAEPGDTLSGLAAELTGSGNDWKRYEFANDPLKTIDPRTLQVGSVINVDNIIGFSNSDLAAKNIMQKVNPISQIQKIEYGGFVYVQGGTIYYTRPTTDNSENSWDPKNHNIMPPTPGAPQYTLNSDQIVSAWYHTHPFILDPSTGQSKYKSEEFSGWIPDSRSPTGFSGDMHLSDLSGLPGYVITPSNTMMKYTPLSTIPQPPYTAPNSITGTILSAFQNTSIGISGSGIITGLKGK